MRHVMSVMKWFTRDYVTGVLSDDEFDRVLPSYRAHVEMLRATFRGRVSELVKLNLHDAQFVRVKYDGNRKSLHLVLTVGDLQVDYKQIELAYRNASFVGVTAEQFNTWDLPGRSTEIVFDEVDSFGEVLEHRFLLWPDKEFGVRFDQVNLRK